jgi:hypothetical protein
MPPSFADSRYGHFTNDRSLSEKETQTLVSWVDQGAPEGVARARALPAAELVRCLVEEINLATSTSRPLRRFSGV